MNNEKKWMRKALQQNAGCIFYAKYTEQQGMYSWSYALLIHADEWKSGDSLG